MSFGSPSLLFALIAVPVLLGGYFVLETRRARRARAWTRPAMLPNLVEPEHRRRYAPIGIFTLALALLLVGLARPQFVSASSDGDAPTVVLTFDVSGSMDTRDVRPSRIRAARTLAEQFLRILPPRIRVAVVTFGNVVTLSVPPTFDRAQVEAALPSAVTPHAGTSLGDGVNAGVAAIAATTGSKQGVSFPGAILLLSDGLQTDGGTMPAQAAQIASIERVHIDTVTIGTTSGTVTQRLTVDGLTSSVQFPTPASSDTMRYLSRETGGVAFDVTSAAGLPSVAKQLSSVYTTLGSTNQPIRRRHDLSAAAGGAALVAILIGILVSTRWFGRVA